MNNQTELESLRAELEAERKKNRGLEEENENIACKRNEATEQWLAECKVRRAITAERDHYKQLVEESRKQEPVGIFVYSIRDGWNFRPNDEIEPPEGEYDVYAAPIVPQEVPEGFTVLVKALQEMYEAFNGAYMARHIYETAMQDERVKAMMARAPKLETAV